MDNKKIAAELVRVARELLGATKRLTDITDDDMIDMYVEMYHKGEPFSDSDRKQFGNAWMKRVGNIILAIKEGDEALFRKNTSLSRSNYLGKVTKILMVLTGIRRAKNLDDLFGQMQDVM